MAETNVVDDPRSRPPEETPLIDLRACGGNEFAPNMESVLLRDAMERIT